MTIYRTLLTRGYFPKELPPSFYTEQFAKYATTRHGHATLAAYKPLDNFTDCLSYELAMPGQNRRELRIPHPFAFARIAEIAAKYSSRLLKIASGSPFARSRPIYSPTHPRAIRPMMSPPNLAKERSAIRAGASYLLKADISQFYSSLYTHAVGWAVNPQLRTRTNWRNNAFLGKKLDQAIMDANGKISQGLPIGNDVSFLLAEVVLARVDRALRSIKSRAYRWFDDYEIAFDTREQAESGLKTLQGELARFKLRLNPAKTKIVELPGATQESWQHQLLSAGRTKFRDPRDMVEHFDTAFRLREIHPEAPILLYAVGVLFGITCPGEKTGRIAESCITQALLAEPGVAQKVFALLSFWRINGYILNKDLIRETICNMIIRHQWRGASSDVAWALAFCLEEQLTLNKRTAKVLSQFEDDCIMLQALHLHSSGLIPAGFSTGHIKQVLKTADLDREHWLLSYEAVRHGFLPTTATAVSHSSLFADLLAKKVTFYRTTLPAYALIVHLGGGPEWVIRRWLEAITSEKPETTEGRGTTMPETEVFRLMERDAVRLARPFASVEDARESLLDLGRKEAGEDAAFAELPEQSVIF